jgi:acetyl esterase/lipase
VWQLSLLVSPRPGALVLRRAFAANGAAIAAALAKHVPPGIEAVLDEPYGAGLDERLDVYRPAGDGPLPAVVWIHGGGWIGGSKEELANWCRLIAGEGFAVASVGYSLAPAHRYPTPVRQALAALAHVQANAERLGLDPGWIVLAGDSAGAHIAAQVALIATDPAYAQAVGLESTLAPERLRGVVLACGPFDLSHATGSTPAGTHFLTTVLWAYSGRRRFGEDPNLALASVTDHVTERFPPAFVTVGNADPLRVHSEALVRRLEARGVEVDTLFWPDDHDPPLAHEYQFDLDAEAGRYAFDRMVAFLRQR